MLVDVIGGSEKAKMQDAMAHAADLFEPSKRFAVHSRIDVNVDSSEIAIQAVMDAYKKEHGYVLFAGVRGESYYLEQDISVISTVSGGRTGWLLFADMLKKLGYSPVTDSTMKVTSIQ